MSVFKNCKSLSLLSNRKDRDKKEQTKKVEQKIQIKTNSTVVKMQQQKLELKIVIKDKERPISNDAKQSLLTNNFQFLRQIQGQIMISSRQNEQSVDNKVTSVPFFEEKELLLTKAQILQRLLDVHKKIQSLRFGQKESFIELTNYRKLLQSKQNNTNLPTPLFPQTYIPIMPTHQQLQKL